MKTKLAVILAALLSVPAVADTVEVRIEKMKFVPQEIRIKAGDTVRWKSYERRGYHTVWFKDEGVAESEPLFPEESWAREFGKSGEYPYLCGAHPEMTGRIVVE